MIRNMLLMHELRGILRTQEDRLIVTFNTFSLRHMAVPLNDAEMAFLASHSSRDVLFVIEVPSLDLNVPLRLNMTGSATPNGAREALLLPLWTGVIIVTDEAVDFVNGQVQPLNQLGVATCAAQFHPPSQFT